MIEIHDEYGDIVGAIDKKCVIGYCQTKESLNRESRGHNDHTKVLINRGSNTEVLIFDIPPSEFKKQLNEHKDKKE